MLPTWKIIFRYHLWSPNFDVSPNDHKALKMRITQLFVLNLINLVFVNKNQEIGCFVFVWFWQIMGDILIISNIY